MLGSGVGRAPRKRTQHQREAPTMRNGEAQGEAEDETQEAQLGLSLALGLTNTL